MVHKPLAIGMEFFVLWQFFLTSMIGSDYPVVRILRYFASYCSWMLIIALKITCGTSCIVFFLLFQVVWHYLLLYAPVVYFWNKVVIEWGKSYRLQVPFDPILEKWALFSSWSSLVFYWFRVHISLAFLWNDEHQMWLSLDH